MTLSIASSNNVQPVTPVQQTPATPGRSPLNSGDVLEALVLSRHADGKVTLQVKNTSIAAETLVALKAGEKLTVRVEQTLPHVVLRIVGGTAMQKLTELLCLHRSNPGAFADLFSASKNALNPALIEAHAGPAAARSAGLILQILDRCVFSRTTEGNPLFLKDLMSWIGLLLERDLMAGRIQSDRMETVKELLLKLAGEIREAGAAPHLKETLAFLQRGAKAIEGQQIAAVLGQELDRTLVLQAACQFPTGIRMQDIFIELDSEGPDGLPRFQCVLLLSMDALGEVIADASVWGGRLDCVLYCETPDIMDFMNLLLPELRDRLAAAGYAESFVRCMLKRDMQDAKSGYLAQKKLYSIQAVDIHT
jgi:hypothetical protein